MSNAPAAVLDPVCAATRLDEPLSQMPMSSKERRIQRPREVSEQDSTGTD